MALLLEPGVREKLVSDLRGLGYLYAALDLGGFVSGNLNAALKKRPGAQAGNAPG